MWHIPLSTLQCNGVLQDTKTIADLAEFYHASLFSPVISTLLRSIKNRHFLNWPGLTTQLITKHLHKKPATVKGHLRLQKQNIK